VEPTVSSGYRDIILGWHMSAFEQILTYCRFNGRLYAAIGSATLRFDRETGKPTLVPK